MADSYKNIFKGITSVIPNPRDKKKSPYKQSSVNGVSHEQIRLLLPGYESNRIKTLAFFTRLSYNRSVGFPTTRRLYMPMTAVRSYDAKLDSKRRITLRNVSYEYFHVEEFDDGRILLEPRELTKPFQVSANTLSMMDSSMENLKAGKVSEPIDLSIYEDVE